MRITVFGAAGSVGRHVVAEALARGHAVTAVVRNPERFAEVPAGAELRTGDAGKAADVAELSRDSDVVVGATRPAPGRESDLVDTARSLLAGVGRTGARLLLVGGAATLTVPGTGTTVMEAPDFPADLAAIARACAEQLAVCRAATGAAWTYLSPPALLEPGGRTGRYRLGGDELVVDARGVSRISMGDLASVLLDEAERPRHLRARFTAAY
ncbi:NAD(P)-dependent oxidoreductase [Streptomonospora nanhaiensis]|uniref:Putative NADH-flavin reductase n=1 Tax=Streptomonospora nanhaiensis TaxID=1323731 RepID=A0A853BU32_9ACTN|nr:NAD(P)H-binding protein [Streptomonospora nanhaiensis]MBV2363591.1 NAD(P)H-binding protein [Streptomonospora nanhaiensis]NYI98633.1 putative NADH-flavin reductase [Streptomonospora nanhaiensis]